MPKLKIKLKPEQRSSRFVLRTKKLRVGYPENSLFDCGRPQPGAAGLRGPDWPKRQRQEHLPAHHPGRHSAAARQNSPGRWADPGLLCPGARAARRNRRVLDEVLAHKPMSPEEARRYLGQYLFRGDDVFKQVGDLSGGERGRLALALLALDEANFLLLDEPTNHLDIPSQEALQAVLEQFDGTIVLVSHDRYLVDRLATQIWELRDQHLYAFDGTYQEFLATKEGGEAIIKTISSKVALPTKEKVLPPVNLDWIEDVVDPLKVTAEDRRERSRRIREVTEQIEETEGWLEQLTFQLARAHWCSQRSA
jgi:ATP-binding cassette subfamily F protein 3